MTKFSGTFNSLLRLKKTSILIVMVFVFVLIAGMRISYAFYEDTQSISIVANAVGDFDTGDGDVNMILYKKSDDGKWVRTYTVPALGYEYKSNLTTCTIPCTNGTSGNCYYNYDTEAKSLVLTSNEKVTCKFYFDKQAGITSDVNIYVYREDASGTRPYNSKNYTLVNGIPAYGYQYSSHTCDNNSTLTYDAENKKFNINTSTKDTCYVYFNSTGSADINVNVYIQKEKGTNTYNLVSTIPFNNTYVLSTNKISRCYNESNTTLSSTITYTNGYINIDATGKQTCDVYLDLQ